MDKIKNFGIMMPTDICRHPDGTPMRYMSHETKMAFIGWCWERGIVNDFDGYTGAKKEQLADEFYSEQDKK